MFTSLLIFPTEMKHLVKERKSAMYSLSAFYVARTASDIPADLALPSMLIVIVYWMAWLNPTAAAFFATWGTYLLVLLVSSSIGLLIGALVLSVKTAQALAATLMLTFILVGGFFVQGIPDWISWIKYLSFLNYAYPLLLHIQFGDTGNVWSCLADVDGQKCQPVEVADPAKNPEICEAVADISGDVFRLSVDISSTTAAVVNAMVLVGMLILFRVAVYASLLWKTRM